MRSTDPEIEMGEPVEGQWDPPIDPDFVEDGYLVPILRRANFAFDGRDSGVQSGVIAYGVDVSEWVSGSLVVLTHARGAWAAIGGSTASFAVEVQNVALDPDAPDLEMIETARTIVTITAVNAASSVPRYQCVAFTPPFGPNLRVRWVFEQGGSRATASLTLAVSVYLVGRRA